MKKMYLALIVAALMILPSVAQANLLSNPGFDADTGMPPTDWTIISAGYGGAVESPAWARSSANVLKFWNGNAFTYQDFAVTEGTAYTASIWAYAAAGDAPQNFEGYVKLDFPGFTEVESTRFDGSILDTWTKLSATGTAPTGATTGRLTIVFADLDDPNGGAIGFDDADADVVPEPSSLLLLISGITGLFVVSRKKK